MWVRRSRPLAAAVLALFAGTFALPLVSDTHAFGADVDAGWGERRVIVCHPDTHIELPKDAGDEEHCAICHWVRAFGASSPSARVRLQAPGLLGLAAQSGLAANRSTDPSQGPPRGPPASSL